MSEFDTHSTASPTTAPLATPVRTVLPPSEVVPVLEDDAAALDAARRFAADIAPGAASRDRDRTLPVSQIDTFTATGLWGITVPRSHGGTAVSHITLAEVVAIVSAADPSIGQIPQNHYCLVDAIRLVGTPAQQDLFFAEALRGKRFGNAVSEIGTPNSKVLTTRLSGRGDTLQLDGRKAYSTGALLAHWVPVAALDEDDRQALVYVPRDAPGLTVIDDWRGFGQRTTASGTVIADKVRVDPLHVVARHKLFDPPTIHGPFAQLLHAAIDLGIARAALDDLRYWLLHKARPWADSGVSHASEDPHTLSRVGALVVRLHAAEALLERGGRALDLSSGSLPAAPSLITAASIAVAEAKIATTELALDASSTLIELGGTQSTLADHNLDRHWRNARTHTVHDPIRWKYHVIGDNWLNGTAPL